MQGLSARMSCEPAERPAFGKRCCVAIGKAARPSSNQTPMWAGRSMDTCLSGALRDLDFQDGCSDQMVAQRASPNTSRSLLELGRAAPYVPTHLSLLASLCSRTGGSSRGVQKKGLCVTDLLTSPFATISTIRPQTPPAVCCPAPVEPGFAKSPWQFVQISPLCRCAPATISSCRERCSCCSFRRSKIIQLVVDAAKLEVAAKQGCLTMSGNADRNVPPAGRRRQLAFWCQPLDTTL